MKRDKIAPLAEALQLDPASLITDEQALNNAVPPKLLSNIIPITKNTKFIKIPVIERVAAGLNCFDETNIIDYHYVLADDINPNYKYVFLKVKGDSMYPDIKENDYILVRCQSSVDSGSFAVVIVDDEDGVVKNVVYGKDFIELRSINPMYPIRRFEGRDVMQIHVFGLVKQVVRKF